MITTSCATVTQLKQTIQHKLLNDKSLAQDVIDTCEVIDSAKKDLFKQLGSDYAKHYANVWNVFLERLGFDVQMMDEQELVNTEKADHIIRVNREGVYKNVHEIWFLNAYSYATIKQQFTDGNFRIKDAEYQNVNISDLIQAVAEVRLGLKRQYASEHFLSPDMDVNIKALKILLNTHYVATLDRNQQQEVAVAHGKRLHAIKEIMETHGIEVICGHIDTLFVTCGDDKFDEAMELVNLLGYKLHTERHGRCIFNTSNRYVLNIRGEIRGSRLNVKLNKEQ